MRKLADDPRPTSTLSHRGLGGATSVAVSPSGRDVYVASSNPGALAHYCVDESTAELQEISWQENATPIGLDLNGASLVSGIVFIARPCAAG